MTTSDDLADLQTILDSLDPAAVDAASVTAVTSEGVTAHHTGDVDDLLIVLAATIDALSQETGDSPGVVAGKGVSALRELREAGAYAATATEEADD